MHILGVGDLLRMSSHINTSASIRTLDSVGQQHHHLANN